MIPGSDAYHKHYKNAGDWFGAILLSYAIVLICIISFGVNLPGILSPEYYAIQSVLRSH
jgi:hypothetical protein